MVQDSGKILEALIAIILIAREAAPAELGPGQASADWVQSYGERNKDSWSGPILELCARSIGREH